MEKKVIWVLRSFYGNTRLNMKREVEEQNYRVSVLTRCFVLHIDTTGGLVNSHALYSGDQNVLPVVHPGYSDIF